jgi:hypothetical protein
MLAIVPVLDVTTPDRKGLYDEHDYWVYAQRSNQ